MAWPPYPPASADAHGFDRWRDELAVPDHPVKVIAHDDNWYLIQTGEHVGRVFDLARGRLFPQMALVSLLARGWSDFSGDEGPILDALVEVAQ